ncbi:hypothetical protein ACIBJF_29215 [Streptomyces sp. NPDC050743]|uniref:hypothetical protein n=1 Tax=Streptomyces sp. NPDC050743 TaxID=3365634 RepID=UPI0037BD1EA5
MGSACCAGRLLARRSPPGGSGRGGGCFDGPEPSPRQGAKARAALLALRSFGLIKLPGGIVESIRHLYGGAFVPWAGGGLVTDGDVILGAAGASGAHAVEDEEAVQTAVRRWQESRSG